MKAITIRNPYAALIAAGVKRIENRTWATSHRGPLAIHASAKPDTAAQAALDAFGVDVGPQVHGAIIAVANLVDCVRQNRLPRDLRGDLFADGPWCWVLADVYRVKPVAIGGSQKIWTLPSGITLEPLDSAAK